MKKIVLIILLLFSNNTFAGRIRDIDFSIDTSNFGETNTFSVTIFLIKKNGKRITLSPNHLSLKWGNLKITGDHIISFKQGIVAFDQSSITQENNKTVLEISYKNGLHTIKTDIIYPYVTSVKINNNTIPVNHFETINYDLVFSNGKTTYHSNSLFADYNLINTSQSEITKLNDQFMIQLNEPAPFETVKLSFKNKLTGKELGEKTILIGYETTCRLEYQGLDGLNGSHGKDGVKISESGSFGYNGQNGTSGNNVRVFAKINTTNSKKYLILQVFSSNGKHQTEILLYNGQPIIINTNGGRGGNGGNGGNGMRGLIDKTKQINSPNGGNGGNAGNAGYGGDAGNIYFVFLNSTENMLSFFSTSSIAGSAGNPGNPGTGGKGDYTDASNLIKMQNSRDGRQGYIGNKGINGKNKTASNPLIISDEEWTALLKKHLSEGFIN